MRLARRATDPPICTSEMMRLLSLVSNTPRPGYVGRQYDGHLNALKRRGLVRFVLGTNPPAGHNHWIVTPAGSALLPPPVTAAVSDDPLAVLTVIQRVMLLMVACACRPGYVAHRRQVTLVALKRRSLLESCPHPTDADRAIWILTPEGRRWVDNDEANR